MDKRRIDLNQSLGQTGTPYVQPGATPHAVGYAAGLSTRHLKGGGLPKYAEPVAGGPSPRMPALEQPHVSGRTMAEQADLTRGVDAHRHVAQAMGAHAGGIIVPDGTSMSSGVPSKQETIQDLRLLPQDLLPAEAAQDQYFVKGAGCQMAQMQPHLAAKYGVVRNGQRLMPSDLTAGFHPGQPGAGAPNGQRARRSGEEIARDLQRVLAAPAPEAQSQVSDGSSLTPPEGIPRTVSEADAQSSVGPGSSAAHAGKAPVPPILDASDTASEDRAKKMLSEMDDLDFERLRREMLADVLKNPEQRETVEARLKPLDVGELIIKNTVSQRVPIRVGIFEPTFTSMPGDVELRLKQLLVQESRSVAVTEAYLLDKYAVMTTTAGTTAINGNPAPSMYDVNGDFNEDLFWEKFRWMLKRNIHMLASLGIHYSWFEQRVRRLFVADEGKGG